MKANPFGASCGTSVVVAPSVAKASTGKIGTRGARLSDTKSGKAPKRVRTKEELESMAHHPAGKALTKRDEALEHGEGCKCYCTVVKREDSELLELLDEVESMAEAHREAVHEKIQQAIADEKRNGRYVDANDAGVLRLIALTAEQIEHLRLTGDNDA